VGRQLWVTYPTTGTTTEGFRDYIFEADVTGRLEHGRAEVDREIFGLSDGPDDDSPRDYDRLDAIRSWGTDVITCTVDTVLGLMQNQRKGLYAWPGLSRSAVVFDEIHSYDTKLFGNLIAFLRELPGLPVLLMTASLPDHRRERLEQVSLSVHSRPLAVVDGPAALEHLPRYVRTQADNPIEAADRCLKGGGKVLWISNTVKRCMRVADQDFGGTQPVVYHSRFRYCDRVDRHARVIELFRRPGAAIATTTQVAEMSLDLSADLLITDIAPIPALIQRLGRLNRRSSPERPEPPKPFMVLPFTGPPYDRDDELVQAETWLERLGTGPLSQHDLVAAWTNQNGTIDEVTSAWIEGGFNTEPYAVRDAGVGITVLLEEDARRVRAGTEKALRVALPMNQSPTADWRKWPRTAFLPVCPAGAIEYDPERGAQWRSQ
jgi:CRISPR-associated endonuclease/helicase Cas3